MSDEHERAVASAREYLAEHYEVVDELAIPDRPGPAGRPTSERTRLAFAPRDASSEGVGHVLVDTSWYGSVRRVVGDLSRDSGLASAPPDLALEGLSNEGVLGLYAFAREHSEVLAVLGGEARSMGDAYHGLFTDPWDLMYWSHTTTLSEVGRIERVVHEVASGTPPEWVARHLLGRER